MVYRQHARKFAEERSDDPDQTLLRYNASGRRGVYGADGAHGVSGGYGGGDGSDGRDAGPAGRGEEDGRIDVTLTRGIVAGTVELRGQLEWSLPLDTPEGEQAFAERLLKGPILERGITTDAEVMQDWPMRVLPNSELRDIAKRGRRRESRRRSLMSTFSNISGELRRAEGTEELLDS